MPQRVRYVFKVKSFGRIAAKLMRVVMIQTHKTHSNIRVVKTSRVTTALYHIGEASHQLGVSPEHLRALERTGRIPMASRDHNGRTYSSFDIALLRALGVGSRPRRLKRLEDLLRAAG